MTEKKARKTRTRSFMAQPPASAEGAKRTFGAPPGNGKSDGSVGPTNDATGTAKPTEKQSHAPKPVESKPENPPETWVPAWKIRNWHLQDRSAESLEHDPSFEELKQEVRALGVQETLAVRKLDEPDDNGCEYEQVTGFKRLTAAMQINPSMLLPIRVVDSTSLELVRRQASENSGRSKPPWWDRALHYRKVANEHGIESATELAKVFGVSRELASTLLRFADQMPRDFIEGLTLVKLSRDALAELVKAVDDLSGETREAVIDRIIEQADRIDANPQNAVKIIQKAAGEALAEKKGSQKPAPSQSMYRSQKGKTLSMKHDAKKATLTLHPGALEVVTAEELEKHVMDMLTEKGLVLEKEQ